MRSFVRITPALAAAALAACATTSVDTGEGPAPRPSAERAVDVPGIPGVVAEGAAWRRVWQHSLTADGVVAAPDGALLFAQEQADAVLAVDADDAVLTFIAEAAGVGSLSFSADGRLLAVERTCTDPGLRNPNCPVPTRVVELLPARRTIADAFPDGRPLGRLNDLTADSRGGAYFTVGGAYYARPDGTVVPVYEGEGYTNGILLSRDERVLYVTRGEVVLAFDVAADGSTANQREFARLEPGDSGDGMAVDEEGRLYVTGVSLATSLYVFDETGARLGVIPTPRQPVSVAFAGPGKRTLYLSAMGALDTDGQEHAVPDGVRNTAMSLYALDMEAAGFAGRGK